MNEHDFLIQVGGKPTVLMGADPDDPKNISWNFGVRPITPAVTRLIQAKPTLHQALPFLQGRWDGKSTVNHWDAVRRYLGENKVNSLIQSQPRGTCFPGDALVVMADGSKKPIAQVAVGEMILNHRGSPRKVLRTMQREYTGRMVDLHIGDKVLCCTEDHPLLVYEGENCSWQDAGLIQKGRQVVQVVPREEDLFDIERVDVDAVDAHAAVALTVFNLETDGEHTYLIDGIAVHNCGSRAGSLTGDLVQCILGAAGKQRFTFRRVSHAAIYFTARKLYDMLNGDWRDDNNDGVASGSVPEALKRYGACHRDEIGDAKYYGEGSDDLACQLGAGLLPELQDKILQLASDNLITDWYPVRSAQELADGIAAGGIGLGSDAQGFTMTRDRDGFCAPHGTWYHYQVRASVGVFNGRKGFGYAQSWGVNTPDGPLLPGHPGNSFGVDFDVQDRIIRSGQWVIVMGWQPWDLENEDRLVDWIFNA